MTTMRRRCGYIYWGEHGTTLAFGWAVGSRGAHRGVSGPTHYLIEPADGGAARWVAASSIDFDLAPEVDPPAPPADRVPVDRPIAHEAGFRLPVLLTRGAYEDCVAWTEEDGDRTGVPQDEPGRLWDVLYLAAGAARSPLPNGQPRGVRDLPVSFSLYRVSRTLGPDEAGEREWAGEEIADLVQLVLRRGEGHTLVIELAPEPEHRPAERACRREAGA